MNTHIEGINRVIAIYMGATIDEHNRVYGLGGKGYYHLKSLSYHRDWNSLIPVIEKIFIPASGFHKFDIVWALEQLKNYPDYNSKNFSDISDVHLAVYKWINSKH